MSEISREQKAKALADELVNEVIDCLAAPSAIATCRKAAMLLRALSAEQPAKEAVAWAVTNNGRIVEKNIFDSKHEADDCKRRLDRAWHEPREVIPLYKLPSADPRPERRVAQADIQVAIATYERERDAFNAWWKSRPAEAKEIDPLSPHLCAAAAWHARSARSAPEGWVSVPRAIEIIRRHAATEDPYCCQVLAEHIVAEIAASPATPEPQEPRDKEKP